VAKDSKKLLVVEDDPGLQSQLKWSLDSYEVLIAGDQEAALKILRRCEPSVVTLDLGLPPDPGGVREGLALLEQIMALVPTTKVIVITGNDDQENSVKAIGLGAYDFYHKPIDPNTLSLTVERAFRLFELEEQNRQLSCNHPLSPLEGVIAASPEMLKVCRTIEKVAPTDVTTLLLGESGTGKEVLAKALHHLSNRKDKRFVAVNCAAIPENLLESELFGYEKGAFTGAAKQTPGKIEYADGGTFFLDEIGDLSMPLQAKLLRFLQERVVERVGGRKPIPVDIRVIGATHQRIGEMIKEGTFREDLYYRLSEIIVQIPPVRDRMGDRIVLAKALLDRFCEQHNQSLKSFAQSAVDAIESYRWPGNVREMENRIKRALIMSESNQITAEDLELEEGEGGGEPFNLKAVRDQAEKTAIRRALSYTNGNISKAAELLGLTRPTLYSLLKKFGLKYE